MLGKLLSLILVCIFCQANAISSPVEVCESGHPYARYFRGHCFIVGEDIATWSEAKEKCKTFRNGHLAVASSPKLADYIAQNILTPQGYNESWIGLKQSEDPLSQWFWYHKTHDYGQSVAILDKNFTALGNSSNGKCMTIQNSSPRLKNEDCKLVKNYVCQYGAFGDQRFRKAKSLINKRPRSSSAAISIQVSLEERCTAICGMSPALSLSFNPMTHHCQIHLEFTDELELIDAPGYITWGKVGQESVQLGCIVTDGYKFVQDFLENAATQLDDGSDYAMGPYDVACVDDFYLTEENPTDNKWYTCFTPPQLICKKGGTWGLESASAEGKKFKCLNIPETFPVYEGWVGGVRLSHYFATTGGSPLFYAIRNTAYCPEKQAIFYVFGQCYPWPRQLLTAQIWFYPHVCKHDRIYTRNQGYAIALNGQLWYFYQGVWASTYVVAANGACGASGRVYQYSHPGNWDHLYRMDGANLGAGWAYDGPVWWAWRKKHD